MSRMPGVQYVFGELLAITITATYLYFCLHRCYQFDSGRLVDIHIWRYTNMCVCVFVCVVNTVDIMIKSVDSGGTLPRFKSCVCHLWSV